MVVEPTGGITGTEVAGAAVEVEAGALLKKSRKPGMGGGESGRGICSWVIGSMIRAVGSRTIERDNSSWASWKSS